MAIEWTKDLESGIRWQDKQHMELFKRLDNLLEAMKAGIGSEEIFKVFRFLDDYYKIHFMAEEEQMEKTGYPDRLLHREQHNLFRVRMLGLEKELKTRPGAHLVILAQRELVHWLAKHIGGDDKKLAAHLKTASPV